MSLPPAPAVIAVVMVAAAHQSIQGAKLVVVIDCLAGINPAGIVEHHGKAFVAQKQSQEIGVAPSLKVAGSEVVAKAVYQPAAYYPGPFFQA
ncbi:unnamed protein product, partial [marine sediment metagenome]